MTLSIMATGTFLIVPFIPVLRRKLEETQEFSARPLQFFYPAAQRRL